MRFAVLGSLEVRTDEGVQVRIPELKVRALLARLLVTPNRPVSPDRIVDDLWGRLQPANPSAVLRSKVSQLRRALEDAEPGGRDLISYQRSGYALAAGAGTVDVHVFEDLVSRATRAPGPKARVDLLVEALSLWRGPPFADFADEPFAIAVVARLDEQRLAALELLAGARLELGENEVVAAELADVVTAHPLRERLRAAQMLALYRLGRQGEALAAYHDLRTRLREDLGLDPGPEIAGMHDAILRHDPTLRSGHASPVTVRQQTNLPASLTDLIGRRGAVEHVLALLHAGRLVTLTGPGGVGKTRLAVETAGRLLDDYPDGVWLVELSALERAQPAEVAVLVADTLGLRDDGRHDGGSGDPRVARLVSALKGKRLLLVLDNCEHVVDAAAALAQQVLTGSPGVRVLATSQHPLGLPVEVLLPVDPLDLPVADDDPALLRRSGAVQLFLARVGAAAPGFTVDRANAPVIAAICRRLDGIPLALELAATRVRAMGVAALANGLDDRFRLLASGRRAAPARQQTLQAMIDWSWHLLAEPEQRLLRRLAVHVDGVTLHSAEHTCALGDLDPRDVADLLTRLVDRSLVVAIDGPQRRYRLLESVSAYSHDRLVEAGELDLVRLRHAEHYTELAERADQLLRGPDQREWLARLDAETGNLRAARSLAVQRGDTALALRLVCALAWYWVLRGRIDEGCRALTAALELPGDSPRRVTAITWLSGITGLGGRYPDPTWDEQLTEEPADQATARAALLRAIVTPIDMDRPLTDDPVSRLLTTFGKLEDEWGTAAGLSALAYRTQLRGEFAAAEHHAQESHTLFSRLGDQWGVLQASNSLAALNELNGDYDAAGALWRQGLDIAQELGLWTEVSRQLAGLAKIAVLRGEYGEADTLYQQSRTLAAEQSVMYMEQVADLGMAVAARRQGTYTSAERLLEPWLAWNHKAQWSAGVATVLAELGYAAEQRGDLELALDRQREGYLAASTTNNAQLIAGALEGIAGAMAAIGQHSHAARLLGTATAARESIGAPLPPAERFDVDRITAAAVAGLGRPAFDEEFALGRDDPETSAKLAEFAGTPHCPSTRYPSHHGRTETEDP